MDFHRSLLVLFARIAYDDIDDSNEHSVRKFAVHEFKLTRNKEP